MALPGKGERPARKDERRWVRLMAGDLTIGRVRIALSIAGSDPTGGAGLQLDLQVFRALGVHGAALPTALTIQDTTRVHRVLPVFPNVVLEQIRTLIRDMPPHALKLGMLATDDVARQVHLGLLELLAPRKAGEEARPPALVIDPVLAASDGSRLLERRALGVLGELIGLATLVTPNLPEAQELTGVDVATEAGIEDAARRLVSEFGAGAALVKGGHRDGPPHDVLARREGSDVVVTRLAGERVEGAPVHGTGCALSAAITAGLARGKNLDAAIHEARVFVREAICHAVAPGRGARLLGF